jgi:hypothetical protein
VAPLFVGVVSLTASLDVNLGATPVPFTNFPFRHLPAKAGVSPAGALVVQGVWCQQRFASTSV